MDYNKNNHTQMSPLTYSEVVGAVASDINNMFGVGVPIDSISGQGVNFQNVNFGVQMETKLTTDNPNALYLFVRNRSTLVFTPNGVQVVN